MQPDFIFCHIIERLDVFTKDINMQSTKVSFYTLVTTALFLSMASAHADTEVAYDMSEISALQNEYQKQLSKPKAAPKKRASPKRVSKPVTKAPVRQLSGQQSLRAAALLLQNQQKLQARKRQLQQQLKQRQNLPPRRAQAVQPRPKAIRQPQQRAPVPTNNELFDAASRGDVRTLGQLISHGMNVNSGNAERETALHMAAAKGQYSAVIYLLNHGANINARTVTNWLPIHHATRFRHAQIANYLKQRGSSPYAKTSDGKSAIDMAKANNDRRILGAFGVR